MNVTRCPRCGCNDLERRPSGTLWGVPGEQCACHHCGCRFQVEADDLPQADAVRFQPLRCPSCGSADTHVASTRRQRGAPTVRYHGCDDCGLPFKSVES